MQNAAPALSASLGSHSLLSENVQLVIHSFVRTLLPKNIFASPSYFYFSFILWCTQSKSLLANILYLYFSERFWHANLLPIFMPILFVLTYIVILEGTYTVTVKISYSRFFLPLVSAPCSQNAMVPAYFKIFDTWFCDTYNNFVIFHLT